MREGKGGEKVHLAQSMPALKKGCGVTMHARFGGCPEGGTERAVTIEEKRKSFFMPETDRLPGSIKSKNRKDCYKEKKGGEGKKEAVVKRKRKQRQRKVGGRTHEPKDKRRGGRGWGKGRAADASVCQARFG